MKPRRHRPHPLARCHAALLAWAVLMLVLTPVGATLHAMTHLGHAPLRVLAALHMTTGTAAIAAADDDDNQGPDAHCHTCDEWQVLDHVLTPAPLLVLPPPALHPHAVPTPRPALLARSPWILPRAPPAQA